MALSITTTMQMDTVTLHLCGRLAYPETQLSEKIHSLLQEGKLKLIIDMSGVSYVDSHGLGQLILIWMEVKSKAATVNLAGPTERVRRLFEISKLDSVFNIVNDEASMPSPASALIESA